MVSEVVSNAVKMSKFQGEGKRKLTDQVRTRNAEHKHSLKHALRVNCICVGAGPQGFR